MTRAGHIAFAKDRALALLDGGNVRGAYDSFLSDMQKHPETHEHPALELGVMLMAIGDLSSADGMRCFIEGFA